LHKISFSIVPFRICNLANLGICTVGRERCLSYFQRAYAPRFYSTQPWQKAFSDIGEIADQANSAYGSFYLGFFERSAVPFLHHIRLVVGATHEKIEADSGAIQYSYRDGGTEASACILPTALPWTEFPASPAAG